jgi:hypothetical protein
MLDPREVRVIDLPRGLELLHIDGNGVVDVIDRERAYDLRVGRFCNPPSGQPR